MPLDEHDIDKIIDECSFSTSRGGGPGGQHVNKVETKVILKWNVNQSDVLDVELKKQILDKLGSRINKVGELVLVSQDSRSQLQNKQKLIETLPLLINQALVIKKKRRKTKPTRSSVEKRLNEKRRLSDKKKLRGKNESGYN